MKKFVLCLVTFVLFASPLLAGGGSITLTTLTQSGGSIQCGGMYTLGVGEELFKPVEELAIMVVCRNLDTGTLTFLQCYWDNNPGGSTEEWYSEVRQLFPGKYAIYARMFYANTATGILEPEADSPTVIITVPAR